MNFSLIIPVYNVEDYISQCLTSIFSQSYKDFEVIIINDGSTDNSGVLIKDFINKHDNIIYIEQENKGQSHARNRGLHHASGDYVFFLDSDDYLDIDFFEVCSRNLNQIDLDILTFDASVVNEIADRKTKESYDRQSAIESGSIWYGPDFLYHCLSNDVFKDVLWLCLYKRSFIKTHNLLFKEGIILEDSIYTTQAFLSAKKVKYINRKLYTRRIRSDSTMHAGFSLKHFNSLFVVIEELYQMTNNIQDYKLQHLLLIRINNVYNKFIKSIIRIGNPELQIYLRKKIIINTFSSRDIQTRLKSIFPFLYLFFNKLKRLIP